MTGATEDAIDEAVLAHARAEHPGLVVTGWIVIASTLSHDGTDTSSGVAMIYPGGSMPWTTALGLIEAARLRAHHDFNSE
jgi:hypothetical protein